MLPSQSTTEAQISQTDNLTEQDYKYFQKDRGEQNPKSSPAVFLISTLISLTNRNPENTKEQLPFKNSSEQ